MQDFEKSVVLFRGTDRYSHSVDSIGGEVSDYHTPFEEITGDFARLSILPEEIAYEVGTALYILYTVSIGELFVSAYLLRMNLQALLHESFIFESGKGGGEREGGDIEGGPDFVEGRYQLLARYTVTDSHTAESIGFGECPEIE